MNILGRDIPNIKSDIIGECLDLRYSLGVEAEVVTGVIFVKVV